MKEVKIRIREAKKPDLEPLLELYTQLHDNKYRVADEEPAGLWRRIMSDKNRHIIIGVENDKIVSSCDLIIIENLTQNRRPYALIENVITRKDRRNKGYASQVLNFAKDIALKANCYKIMLMTGSKEEQVLGFYEKNGYNRKDKTAFIQWLKV